MLRRTFAVASAVLVLSTLTSTDAKAAAQRTFVASYGVSTNTAFNCSIAKPCRQFSEAIGVTNAGGEVIVLDSAGYGPATINQSISIIAPDGVYAGISVFTGNGDLAVVSIDSNASFSPSGRLSSPKFSFSIAAAKCQPRKIYVVTKSVGRLSVSSDSRP